MSVQPVDMMTPYSTAEPMFGNAPGYLSEMDAQRILSYQVYEQMYWGVPETFKLSMRGSDVDPIYVPCARTVVDTTNRYLAKKFTFQIDPLLGQPTDQDAWRAALNDLFKRERFYAKFASNKRFGLIRGDWVWHVWANPNKVQGKRITIEPIDPASYFPVSHPDNPDKIIAAHIMEVIEDSEGNQVIKRQTYQRGLDPLANDGSDLSIWTTTAIMDLEGWDALDAKPVEVLVEPFQLPPDITSIPLYHIKNLETPGDPFGSSELRGMERIMAAVNQVVSDEELTLALEGLGMYATTGGPPMNPDGSEADTWALGPGRVLELQPDGKMWRVTGATDITAYLKHAEFLMDRIWEGTSTPDVARGSVSVEIAESGIALYLRMTPMLSKIEEREIGIDDVMGNFLYDLKYWYMAYEATNFGDAVATPYSQDPMPIDRSARVKEILDIVEANLASPEWGRTELAKLGYEFPPDEAATVLETKAALAEADDPLAARSAQEALADAGSGAPDVVT